MSFTLDKVVPWGRSYDEYGAMFSLTKADLNKKILGCGDGPASFNAELTKIGGKVVSVDPIYLFFAKDIMSRIDATYDEVMEQTAKNYNEFVWKHIKSIDDLGSIRMKAMERFLEDYPKADGRYISGELPFLPFKNKEFDLALCSHFLFLYSKQHSFEFHIQSIKELCRVASEVRIFPLLELGARKSGHLDKVISMLEKEECEWSIIKVCYEFQKGGNEMLHIKS
ncbi:MAG: SAM-dependent methyltransferase [Desulfobacterium sp.]|nr:SAM-dependent methyltransferase [Desulfobacterium sp.]MBU3946788.1 SAM-dependent methyltransferase [Pseudomonadota bacterium]MBU4009965.1 SAM-dependent methyltransferase [Pseudomonadota bacterium]MBU4037515.1 SAM-dependent methyltransferase [Pseudomonadota bacterium]